MAQYDHIIDQVLVDPEDLSLLHKYRWCTNSAGYLVRNQKGTIILLHREITNAPSGMDVDHKNGNPLDNRKDNLRVVPHFVNCQNQTVLRSDNTSGFRGVSYHTKRRKWRAYGTLKGKTVALGYFKDKKDAIEASQKWREQHYEAV